jgi:hypothetical protein
MMRPLRKAMLRLIAALLLSSPGLAWAADLRVALSPLELVNLTEQEGKRHRRLLEQTLGATWGLKLQQGLDHAPRCEVRERGCLRRLGASLQADRLLALRVGHLADTTVIRLTVYDLTRSVRLGSWQEVLRGKHSDTELKAAFERMVAGFAPPPPPPPRKSPWYTKWWVWTAAGVVVAGGVTAAVLATRGGGDEPDFVINPP